MILYFLGGNGRSGVRRLSDGAADLTPHRHGHHTWLTNHALVQNRTSESKLQKIEKTSSKLWTNTSEINDKKRICEEFWEKSQIRHSESPIEKNTTRKRFSAQAKNGSDIQILRPTTLHPILHSEAFNDL